MTRAGVDIALRNASSIFSITLISQGSGDSPVSAFQEAMASYEIGPSPNPFEPRRFERRQNQSSMWSNPIGPGLS